MQRAVVWCSVLLLRVCFPGRKLKAWAAYTLEWIYDEVHEWKYSEEEALYRALLSDFDPPSEESHANVVPISKHPKFRSAHILERAEEEE